MCLYIINGVRQTRHKQCGIGENSVIHAINAKSKAKVKPFLVVQLVVKNFFCLAKSLQRQKQKQYDWNVTPQCNIFCKNNDFFDFLLCETMCTQPQWK